MPLQNYEPDYSPRTMDWIVLLLLFYKDDFSIN